MRGALELGFAFDRIQHTASRLAASLSRWGAKNVTLALTDPLPAEAPSDAAPGSGSLLASLAIVARHRGVHLSVPQLIHDHQLASAEVSVAEVLRIAGASGLRASRTRLRWRDLPGLGTALPSDRKSTR